MRVLYSGSSSFSLPSLRRRADATGDRHEIAYVFGQLSSPYSIPSLIIVLRNPVEEDMVRHEAAEALGSIANEDCLPVLLEFAKGKDVPRVVRESCEVALDMVSGFSVLCCCDGVDWSTDDGIAVRVRAIDGVFLRYAACGCHHCVVISSSCRSAPFSRCNLCKTGTRKCATVANFEESP